jgi:hypothetical protein
LSADQHSAEQQTILQRRFGKRSSVSKLNACVNSKRASPNNVCN